MAVTSTSTCSICGGAHYGKGLCKSHYMKSYVRKKKPVLSDAAKAHAKAAKQTPEYKEREKARRRERYATDEAYRAKMKALAKATYAANPAPGLARAVEQRKTDRYREYQVAHNCVKRRHLRTATPPWADKKQIKAFYAEARRRGLEVDHIIPLRGDIVSGLHVPENFQFLTRSENARKQKKFNPEAICP